MTLLLNIAWPLIRILSYGSLILALAGVAVFSWYFVRLNARAAHNDGKGIPREAWRGKGATRGVTIFAVGVGMQIASVLLSLIVPGRL